MKTQAIFVISGKKICTKISSLLKITPIFYPYNNKAEKNLHFLQAHA